MIIPVTIASLLGVAAVSQKQAPFMTPVPDPEKVEKVEERHYQTNRLGNRGFRCSQTERLPTDNAMQDVLENLYQKTVNKVTTNLAGFNRRDPKVYRHQNLNASLRPKTEPAFFGELEATNVYSKASYENERRKADRLQKSATRMQNDVPIDKFTTRLGDSSGQSGASRFLYTYRELPHVPLTKGASSIRSTGGDIQTNAIGLGINKSGGSRENYSNIGLVDRQPTEFRNYDGLNRFFKQHQKEGGVLNNRNIQAFTDIERFGSYREDAIEMSRGNNKNIGTPFIGEVHQRGYKENGLYTQRGYYSRNTDHAIQTKYSRGYESRDVKPEVIIADRPRLRGYAIKNNKPKNMYAQYEYSYK